MSPEECSRLNDLLMDTFFLVDKAEGNALKSSGMGDVSVSECHLITCVCAGGEEGRKIGEIAQALDVTLPTVTVMATKLVQKGYIEKVKGEQDGREVFCRITQKGKRVDYLYRYLHRRVALRVGSEFSAEELDILVKCVGKLNSILTETGKAKKNVVGKE